MAMKRLLALLLALALLVPATTQAAGPSLPPIDEPPAGPIWDELPDVAGPLSWRIEQCGECGAAIEEPDVPEWQTTNGDIFSQIRQTLEFAIAWAVGQVALLFYRLMCFFLAMMQTAANILAGAINALIALLNMVVRLVVFVWLSIRSWLYQFYILVEHVRDFFWQLVWSWQYVVSWIENMLLLYAELQAFITGLVWTMVQIFLRLLDMVAWLVALSFGGIYAIMQALLGTSVPSQLQDTHPILWFLRGMLDALLSSSIAWVYWLAIGMVYVAFFFWLSRFMSSSKVGNE